MYNRFLITQTSYARLLCRTMQSVSTALQLRGARVVCTETLFKFKNSFFLILQRRAFTFFVYTVKDSLPSCLTTTCAKRREEMDENKQQADKYVRVTRLRIIMTPRFWRRQFKTFSIESYFKKSFFFFTESHFNFINTQWVKLFSLPRKYLENHYRCKIKILSTAKRLL